MNRKLRNFCFIIGSPIEHSLSPILHNGAYEELGLADTFVFLASEIKTNQVESALAGLRTLGATGITVTMPLKEKVIPFLDDLDASAAALQAVNTIVFREGKMRGYNTDGDGVVGPLQERESIAGKRVAVLGAGGTARAACYALQQAGADVCVFNRTVERAKEIAERFSCDYSSLEDFERIRSSEVLFQATSLGMADNESKSPVPNAVFREGQMAFDAVYEPRKTTFLRMAEENGAEVISGIELLLHQAVRQFSLYTDHKVTVSTFRKILAQHEEGK